MKRTKQHISLLSFIASMLIFFSACVDSFEYRVDEIPEGYSEVTLNVGFDNFTPALDTRSPGDAIKGIENLWVVIYDSNGNHYKTERIKDSDLQGSLEERPGGSEPSTGHAEIKYLIPNGRYRVYAIANIDLSNRLGDKGYLTEEELQNLCVYWNKENIRENAEMFGWFVNGDSNTPRDKNSLTAQTIIVNGYNTSLHAWLRRCASKVTIAYDGTNLNPGVSIYLMGASIKDIPRTCALGTSNTVSHQDSLIKEGGRISYYSGSVDPYSNLQAFFNELEGTDAKIIRGGKYGSNHNDTDEALFFYENMQGEGEDKRQKDEDNDNIPDNQDRLKDDKPFGTYIEVEAVYKKVNTENGVAKPETGIIKYRFMLGKDIISDYNAERNYHYKLNLRFNGDANDIDWHIDYEKQVLKVSEPLVFDYRGMVFKADESIPNLGHEFMAENTVILESYIEHQDKLNSYEILYDEHSNGNFSSTRPSWLKEPVVTPGEYPYKKNVTFKTDPITPIPINLNSYLQSAPSKSENKAAPYNLSNPGQKVNPASATVLNTANSYIVDAAGYYLIPMVYGNAVKNGGKNETSYRPGGTGLTTFVNHLGKEISDPYIKNNGIDLSGAKAVMVWQDEDNLIDYSVWDSDEGNRVEFLPEAFGGKGGIRFRVTKEDIKQGNSIIALIDQSAQGSGNGPLVNTKKANVIWSWHIWVTSLDCFGEDKNITVTSYSPDKNSPSGRKDYDLLAMNLGWCSKAEDIINYYPERSCRVRFKSGDEYRDITILQKSHIAFTCGTNPYFQWGRKDPFGPATEVAITENNNKQRYIALNWPDNRNPEFLSHVGGEENTASTSLLAKLIKFPYLWHNPPRATPGLNGNPYRSINKIYNNLWGEQGSASVENVKTIYDPSPVGYKVPHYNVFTGFTVIGENTNTEDYWYDVKPKNVAGYINEAQGAGVYTKNLYEFYTNKDKTQSIIFPLSGYRDWDDAANAYRFGEIGYAWTAITSTPEASLAYRDVDWVFNFEFSHKDASGRSYIRPENEFFSCDGFPIRPCKE